MERAIAKNLQPEFDPVAVVWSNTIPDDATQFEEGYCQLNGGRLQPLERS